MPVPRIAAAPRRWTEMSVGFGASWLPGCRAPTTDVKRIDGDFARDGAEASFRVCRGRLISAAGRVPLGLARTFCSSQERAYASS